MDGTLTVKKVNKAVRSAGEISKKDLALVARGNGFYVASVTPDGPCGSGMKLSGPYHIGTIGLTSPTDAMMRLATFAEVNYQEAKEELLAPWAKKPAKKTKGQDIVINQTAEIPPGMTIADFFEKMLP